MGLRDFARVRNDQPLNPFELARFANLIVLKFDQIKGLSQSTREHLLGPAVEKWSGGACTLPNGSKLVILNPTHGRARTNATLMEEICHVFLGHQPNRLSVVTKDARGKVMSRDYRKQDEEEAYGVGAAGLGVAELDLDDDHLPDEALEGVGERATEQERVAVDGGLALGVEVDDVCADRVGAVG